MDNAINKANAMMERDVLKNLTDSVRLETIKDYSSDILINELARRDRATQELIGEITNSLSKYWEALK